MSRGTSHDGTKVHTGSGSGKDPVNEERTEKVSTLWSKHEEVRESVVLP